MYTTRTIVAAVIAGIVGTIVNSIAVSLIFGAPLMGLIFNFGREAVAILVALLLPLIYAKMHGRTAHAVAIAALAIIPTVLAQLVFGAGAGWGAVLVFNLIYAVVAVTIYLAIVRKPQLRL